MVSTSKRSPVLSSLSPPLSEKDKGHLFTVDLYIRVSTFSQVEGDSLEEQESELRKFCEYRNFRIRHAYIEEAKSGGTTRRPEYQKLIRDIEQKKIHAVVVKKLDRLSRSLLDFEQLMILMQRHEVEFISIRENFDTTTAMGKAMLRMALVFAQLEREQTSERVADVMQFRASQGLRNGGTTPFGYRTVEKQLVPYAKEKEIVALAFKQFIDTQSTLSVARFLNDLGFKNKQNKPWDCKRILSMLQNPTYKGDVSWCGKLFPGTHPPIISEQTFSQAQYFLKKRHKPTKTNAILQKLLFCGHCSVPMTPNYAMNRSRVKYYYYLCTTATHNKPLTNSICPHKRVALHSIEESILICISKLSQEMIFRPFANRISKHNDAISLQENKLDEAIRAIKDELTKLKVKKDRYFDTLMTQSLLSHERKMGNERLRDLDIEERQLKAKLHKQEFERTSLSDTKIDITDFRRTLSHFSEHYESWDNPTLYLTLQRLIQSIRYHETHLIVQFKVLPWTVDISFKRNL